MPPLTFRKTEGTEFGFMNLTKISFTYSDENVSGPCLFKFPDKLFFKSDKWMFFLGLKYMKRPKHYCEL